MAELADAKLDEKTAASGARPPRAAARPAAREFESLRRTLEALDALPAAAPSHRLRARVMGDIETEKLTLRSQAGWAVVHPRGRRLAPGPPVRARAPAPPGTRGVRPGRPRLHARRAHGHPAPARRPARRVDTMGQLFEQSVLQKGATGDRLETVLTAGEARRPDERVINGLINSMAFDTSVNVRLNALERPLLARRPGGRARRRPRVPAARDQPAGPGRHDRLPRRGAGAARPPPSCASSSATTRRTPTSASPRAARSTCSEPPPPRKPPYHENHPIPFPPRPRGRPGAGPRRARPRRRLVQQHRVLRPVEAGNAQDPRLARRRDRPRRGREGRRP